MLEHLPWKAFLFRAVQSSSLFTPNYQTFVSFAWWSKYRTFYGIRKPLLENILWQLNKCYLARNSVSWICGAPRELDIKRKCRCCIYCRRTGLDNSHNSSRVMRLTILGTCRNRARCPNWPTRYFTIYVKADIRTITRGSRRSGYRGATQLNGNSYIRISCCRMVSVDFFSWIYIYINSLNFMNSYFSLSIYKILAKVI